MLKVPHVTGYLSEHFADDAFVTLAGYQRRGGYESARKALKQMTSAELIDLVKNAGLQGRGGAGFPTGLKWSFMPLKSDGPKYLVCNADESEPGSFKDRILLERGPHMLLEGILIAAWATGADKTFIYVRGEYAEPARILQRAIDEAYAEGLFGEKILGTKFRHDVVLQRGAGAYICGEETGLLNSLEGKRGWPRLKPPFPAVRGLFNAPTVVNNVETLMNLPDIITKGGEWFAGIGMGKSGGTRIVCVSGHVVKPGVYELPMGISSRALIYDVCGGIPNGRTLKGLIPGGSSMPPLDASELDVPIEFDALMTDTRIKDVEVKPGVPFDLGGGRKLKTMAGSGGVVVFDDTTDVVALCARIMEFYAHESCGQCTPCREGSGWLARVCRRLANGQGEPGDVELLANIANGIGGNTICALGDAAAWPMLGFITKFRADFEAKLAHAKTRRVAESAAVASRMRVVP
jgi:NADH-quinone oxidoreductase subunit F